MRKTKEYYQRLLATTDYTNLEPVWKAIRLIEVDCCSVNMAAKLIGMDRSALRRARIAIAENRDIGVNGRPPILNSTSLDLLEEDVLEKIHSGSPPTYKECIPLVSLKI